jgi:hypothetical protein
LVKPLVAATATVKVVDWPWNVLTELTPGATVSVGATTVTPSLIVTVEEPAVPLTAMVPDPAADVVDADTVAVTIVPDFALAGLKVTVTPVGAVAVSATGLVKPPEAPTSKLKVAVCPWNALTEVADCGVKVNVGCTTVIGSLNDAVAEPAMPVTAMVPAPAVAVPDAVTVAVELDPDFTLAGLKVTVTPVGAVADSTIGLVKPVLAPTPTLNVTAWPW